MCRPSRQQPALSHRVQLFFAGTPFGDHGGAGIFQPRGEDAEGTGTMHPAVIKNIPKQAGDYFSSPDRPKVVTLLDRWETSDTTVSSACPSGYTPRYINPINTIPNFNDGVFETVGLNMPICNTTVVSRVP